MKVLPFRIPKASNTALLFQRDSGKSFYDRLHQHEEIQITYIDRGQGNAIIGDSVHAFEDGDVFVVGARTPHLFQNETPATGEVRMFSIFFTKASFGDGFFALEEMQELDRLFQRIETGIRVVSRTARVKELMAAIEQQSHVNRLISFLHLLKFLSQADFETLSTLKSTRSYTDDEGERIGNVMHYAMARFDQTIQLNEVAEVAHMTPNAFCRFFKQRTSKTFFQFLMEIRIGYAARMLLQNPEMTVLEIADKSGFKNISHFNRVFRQMKGKTPSAFRKRV